MMAPMYAAHGFAIYWLAMNGLDMDSRKRWVRESRHQATAVLSGAML
jgi:hypothetical protein